METSTTFKVPDANTRKAAVGRFSPQEKNLELVFNKIFPEFSPVPPALPGCWLHDHPEQPQPHEVFLKQKYNKVDAKRNTIYIQPLEEKIDKELLATVQKFTEAFYYGLNVKILPMLDVQMLKVESRMNWGTKQYCALQIIDKLVSRVPADGYCLIAVMMTDLYPKKDWNFVFGWASFVRRAGVFSFARYDENFYVSEVLKPTDPKLLMHRSARIVAHEVGHMFNLWHCTYSDCVMNGINGLEEFNTKPTELCPVCLRKLQCNIKFSILKRYQKLSEVCQELGGFFIKDMEKYNKLINLIKDIPEDQPTEVKTNVANLRERNASQPHRSINTVRPTLTTTKARSPNASSGKSTGLFKSPAKLGKGSTSTIKKNLK